MNIFKKVGKVVAGKFAQFMEERKYQRQASNTLKLRNEKLSDIERWRKDGEFFEDWNERTSRLASLVPVGVRVIEFGAGTMALKALLPPDCAYTPSDIQKRSKDTLLCDLNDEIMFDLAPYDVAVFSGVLEYVYDLEKVFSQLAGKIDTVILSYACSDIASINRLRSGWLSDYSKEEILAVFEKHQYEVVYYDEWRKQSLFKLQERTKE